MFERLTCSPWSPYQRVKVKSGTSSCCKERHSMKGRFQDVDFPPSRGDMAGTTCQPIERYMAAH